MNNDDDRNRRHEEREAKQTKRQKQVDDEERKADDEDLQTFISDLKSEIDRKITEIKELQDNVEEKDRTIQNNKIQCEEEKENLRMEFELEKKNLINQFDVDKKNLEERIVELRASVKSKSDRLKDMPTVDEIIDEFALELVALSNTLKSPTPTPNDMATFRHETYVNNCNSIINNNRQHETNREYNIIGFLREILNRCLQSLNDANASNKDYYDTQLSEDTYNYKYLSTMISSCLQFLNPKYISTSAYLTMINVLSISKSALCADFINWAMCGGVTSQTIYNKFKKLGDLFAGSRIQCPMTYDVIAVFDNNSTDYKRKTYRSGINQNKKTLVWTNVEAYLFARTRNVNGAEISLNKINNVQCIQNDMSFRPQNWPNFNKHTLIRPDNTIINVTNFEDDSIPNRTRVHPSKTLTDTEYIQKETKNGLLFILTLIKDTPRLLAFYPSTNKPVYEERQYVDQGIIDASSNILQIKECYSCSTRNSKGSRNCGGCDRKLLSIKEYRQHYNQNSSSDLMMKPPPIRKRRKTETKLISLNEDEISFTSNVISTSSNTLSVPLDNDEVEEGEEGEEEESAYYIKILRELLPSICINPNTAAEIKKIYQELGNTFNLVGFTDERNIDLLRYFMYLVSDFGATNLHAIDTDQTYQNFIHIIGTFHECKSFLELTMDLLFSVGGNILAIKHTFASEKAQSYLRRCGDLHKANDFLRDVAKPSLYICFLFEYLVATTETGEAIDFDNINLDDAFSWGNNYFNNSNNKDLKWKNFWFLLSHILPAYELIKKGVRTGNMAAYNAGRRALLPFMFSLSKLNYGPLIIRDMIQYYWKAPKAIQMQLDEIFCLYDEGINGKMEEANKDQKRFVFSDTKSGIQAGAVLSNMSESLRNAMVLLRGNRSGNDVQKAIPERRVPSDLDDDIIECVSELMRLRIFQQSQSKTTIAQRFDKTQIKVPPQHLNDDLSLLNLYEVGVIAKNNYYEAYIRSENNELPPNSRIFTFKKTKQVIDEDGNTQVVDEEDDENENEAIQ